MLVVQQDTMLVVYDPPSRCIKQVEPMPSLREAPELLLPQWYNDLDP